MVAPRILLPLASLLAILSVLSGCGKKDDTDEIRRVIKDGAVLAEKHDIGGLMKLTTEDFRALPGELDGKEVKRYLLYAFMRYKEFKVLYPQPGVDLQPDGNQAKAKFPFLIVQKDQSLPELKELFEDPQGWLEHLGDKADLYGLQIELTKTGGVWRVRRALLEVVR